MHSDRIAEAPPTRRAESQPWHPVALPDSPATTRIGAILKPSLISPARLQIEVDLAAYNL